MALAIAFPIVLIVAAELIRPSAPFATKLEPYECGIKPLSDSRGRYRALGWFSVAEVTVFLAILIVGHVWAYKNGALEWV